MSEKRLKKAKKRKKERRNEISPTVISTGQSQEKILCGPLRSIVGMCCALLCCAMAWRGCEWKTTTMRSECDTSGEQASEQSESKRASHEEEEEEEMGITNKYSEQRRVKIKISVIISMSIHHRPPLRVVLTRVTKEKAHQVRIFLIIHFRFTI